MSYSSFQRPTVDLRNLWRSAYNILPEGLPSLETPTDAHSLSPPPSLPLKGMIFPPPPPLFNYHWAPFARERCVILSRKYSRDLLLPLILRNILILCKSICPQCAHIIPAICKWVITMENVSLCDVPYCAIPFTKRIDQTSKAWTLLLICSCITLWNDALWYHYETTWEVFDYR